MYVSMRSSLLLKLFSFLILVLYSKCEEDISVQDRDWNRGQGQGGQVIYNHGHDHDPTNESDRGLETALPFDDLTNTKRSVQSVPLAAEVNDEDAVLDTTLRRYHARRLVEVTSIDWSMVTSSASWSSRVYHSSVALDSNTIVLTGGESYSNSSSKLR